MLHLKKQDVDARDKRGHDGQSKRPGIAPGPSHSWTERISLEVHSAATDRNRLLPISTTLDFGGLVDGFF